MYNPTCFFTGEKSNLKMHPFRNDNGDMIGWIFVQNAIDMQDSELTHTYKITQAAQETINMIKAMQPKVPEPGRDMSSPPYNIVDFDGGSEKGGVPNY